jgi:hypothetical protein
LATPAPAKSHFTDLSSNPIPLLNISNRRLMFLQNMLYIIPAAVYKLAFSSVVTVVLVLFLTTTAFWLHIFLLANGKHGGRTIFTFLK